jgi:hypothetical protein
MCYEIVDFINRKKVNAVPLYTKQTQRGNRGRYIHTHTRPRAATEGCGWSVPRFGRCTPWKETRCRLYRKLGEPQGKCEWVWKISSHTGFLNPNRYVDRNIRLMLKIRINDIRMYDLTSDIITYLITYSMEQSPS